MCLSSCSGSLNRRPTKLIFNLEDVKYAPRYICIQSIRISIELACHLFSGIEVGRHVVDVRICSCPGRDIKAEEEKQLSEPLATIPIYLPGDQVKSKSKKRKVVPVVVNQPSTSVDGDDDKVYTGSFNVSCLLINYCFIWCSFYWILRGFFFKVRGRKNFEAIQDVINVMLRRFNEISSQNTSAPPAGVDCPQVKRFKEED